MTDILLKMAYEQVPKGSWWKHTKNGREYVIDTLAIACWDSSQVLVIYHDGEYLKPWCRSLNEFLDGRFEHVCTSG